MVSRNPHVLGDLEFTVRSLEPEAAIPTLPGNQERNAVCIHNVPLVTSDEQLKVALRKMAACPIQHVTFNGKGKAVIIFRRKFGMSP